MSKPFKLKLSRAVPSFQICRSKILSETHSPLSKLSRFHPKSADINYPNLPAPPPSTPNSRRKPARSLAHYLADISIESPDFARKGDSNKWPAAGPPPYMRSVSFSDDSFESFCSFVVPEKQKEVNKKGTRDEIVYSCEFADDEQEQGKDETETSLLFSSRSFSCDSSFDFIYPVKTAINGKAKRKDSKKYRKAKTAMSPVVDSPLRSSVLLRMMSCTAVKESVAVVKKSGDPYEDFKRSMLEMILEKQMFEAKELEELLQCFLRLNSRKYHQVIVKAFSEIWSLMFCDSPAKRTSSNTLVIA